MTENRKQMPDWQDIHRDVENGKMIGAYGGDNTAWYGLASLRSKANMTSLHSQHPTDEQIHPKMKNLLEHEKIRENWSKISTIDPLGMIAKRPTMAATAACLTIPELQLSASLNSDGVIVNPDLTVNCIKCAIDYVWNLPKLANAISVEEPLLRKALDDSTHVVGLEDNNRIAYLPPIGGCCVYIFGDPEKLTNPMTEIAVRVHDECIGSDVFGSDICTCRPYLIFALQCCIQCAQRGGVGIVVYYRKEGRSLGEVTKFRVYNFRKNQIGGDIPEQYFASTEKIAGIRDARFQELMPDVLIWLGITRIDWLLSMSSEKYDAIIKAGIVVMQRVSLPEDNVPLNAQVEITAKIASGYLSGEVALATNDLQDELRTLEAIRFRAQKVFELAKQKRTVHFELNLENIPTCVDYVMDITNKIYGDFSHVPYHSRWRHFNIAKVHDMISAWYCSEKEKVRRLLDLVTISVFMDAGAGNEWKYFDTDGIVQHHSEGLAVATFEMFRDGLFSSDPSIPNRVNALGINQINFKQFAKSLQISEKNSILGLERRFEILQKMAKCFTLHPQYFGREVPRPGNILDYLLLHATRIDGHQCTHKSTTTKDNLNEVKNPEDGEHGNFNHVLPNPHKPKYRISIKRLWEAIIKGFENVWTTKDLRKGDIGVYSPLKISGEPGSDFIPFHKLSQWLAYSMIEPLEDFGFQFDDLPLLTGLAEYRNGGLLIDMKVLTPRSEQLSALTLDVGSEAVVEWRALTICCIDLIWSKIREKLNLTMDELPLSKILQGGTWNAGRAIALQKRGDRSAPLQIRSNGVF